MEKENINDEMGAIYILTNPSFRGWEPDLIKIGYTSDLETRLKNLNSATPYSFRVFATYKIPKANADRCLHQIIDLLDPDLHVKELINDEKEQQREFFQMAADDAYRILENIAIMHGRKDMLTKNKSLSEYKTEDKRIIDQIEKRRAELFSFEKCGIKNGEFIAYKDDPAIKAKVINDRQVEYDDEVYYLSPLASKLAGLPYNVRGSDYFKYKDRLLTEIKAELDS